VNYKAGGKYCVLDSDCSQHMTDNNNMFTSLVNPGDHDHVTYVDNTRRRAVSLGRIAITKDSLSQMFYMLNLLASFFFPLLNFMILD
jgi:hypothetical protein